MNIEDFSMRVDDGEASAAKDGGKMGEKAPKNEVSSVQCSVFSGEHEGTKGTEGTQETPIGNLKLEISEGTPPPHVGSYGMREKRIGAMRLRPYQKDPFWDHTSGIVVLHWSRQIGKSYVLAAWAVYRLMTKGGRLVTVLSNSRENGAEFLLKCVEVCRTQGARFETVMSPPKVPFEEMRMELRLRYEGRVGRIKVLAANPRTARGFSGDLILDEFAFHENGDAVWAAAEPILASNKDFLCRIASTGNGRHNLFYRMVERDEVQSSKDQGPSSRECSITKGQEPKGEFLGTDGHGKTQKFSPQSRGGAEEGKEEKVSSVQCSVFSGEKEGTKGTEGTQETAREDGVAAGSSDVAAVGREDIAALRDIKNGEDGKSEDDDEDEDEHDGTNVNFYVEECEGGIRKVYPRRIKNEELKVKNGEKEGTERTEGTEAVREDGVAGSECSSAATGPADTGALRGGEDVPAGRLYMTPYYKSKAGAWVSQVTRTMAHGMGLEIYDSQTRKSITPEQARAQALDKHAYDQNYECSFENERLALLSHELISAAECDDAGEICEQEWTASAFERMRQCKGQLFAGLDVGRKVDLSVLTVLERIDGLFWVRGLLRMRDMRLPDQESRLGKICELRQLKQVCIDMTGLGLGLFEYAQRRLGEHRISGINFASSVSATRVILQEGFKRETVRVTEALAMEVLRAYEDRKVRQPRDWQLREDLRKPGRVTTPGGRVSIAAVRDGAGHADHFWSLALAIEAAGGGSARAPFAYEPIPRRRGLII